MRSPLIHPSRCKILLLLDLLAEASSSLQFWAVEIMIQYDIFQVLRIQLINGVTSRLGLLDAAPISPTVLLVAALETLCSQRARAWPRPSLQISL